MSNLMQSLRPAVVVLPPTKILVPEPPPRDAVKAWADMLERWIRKYGYRLQRPVEIKSLDCDQATVASYGIIFGTSDIQGDMFTCETDLMLDYVRVRDVYFEHSIRSVGGLDEPIGKVATERKDDVGVWIEA
jgi:hypothetical protein